MAKPRFLQKLDDAALEVIRIQEQFPLVAFVSTAIAFIIAAWTIYQFIIAGGGFVPFLINAVIWLFFLFCLYADWRHRKTKRDKALFWTPWVFALLFPFVVTAFTWFYCHQVSSNGDAITTQKNENKAEVSRTNDFYTGITNHQEKIIDQLRRYINGLPTKISYDEMMGIEKITNILSVTNVFAVTNVLTRTTTFVVGRPVLDLIQEESIQSKLASAVHVPILIEFAKKDTNAVDLCKQMGQIFLASGFTNVTVSFVDKNMPVMGVLIGTSNTNKSGPIIDAYLELIKYLGQQNAQFDTDMSAPTNLVEFTVATTTNEYAP